ncbi:MAG: LacI family DNA-binding transcriptional regulator [bacterium]
MNGLSFSIYVPYNKSVRIDGEYCDDYNESMTDEVLSKKVVTQQDIAKRCGVTRTTVSLSLLDDPQIPIATRKRIHIVAEEMGYNSAMQHSARRLIRRRYGTQFVNHAIGVLLPIHYHHSNYFNAILQGIQDVLEEAGYALVISYAPTATILLSLPPIFTSGELDALLVFSGEQYFLPLLTKYRKANILSDCSVISLITSITGCSRVHTDDEQGAYLATRHLLELGHRHFLHSFNPDLSDMIADRNKGIHRAVQEWGLSSNEHVWYSGWTQMPRSPGTHLLIPDFAYPETIDKSDLAAYMQYQQFLEDHPQITAIFGLNDADARRIAYQLQHMGRRIPEDYSLVGFDDVDILSDDRGQNFLTSVYLPLIEVGRKAAQLALYQINSHVQTIEDVLLPTSLSVRGTTGPVPKR